MLATIERIFTLVGWNPRMAKLGMWALIIVALGTIFRVKIRI